MRIYIVNHRIQSEFGKIRTTKTSNTNIFQVVDVFYKKTFVKSLTKLRGKHLQSWTKGWKQIHEIKQNRLFCGMFYS